MKGMDDARRPRPTSTDRCVQATDDSGSPRPTSADRCVQARSDVGMPRSDLEKYASFFERIIMNKYNPNIHVLRYKHTLASTNNFYIHKKRVFNKLFYFIFSQ